MPLFKNAIRQDNTGLPVLNLQWASQATWYIDPISGLDVNSGIDNTHAMVFGPLQMVPFVLLN